MSLRNPSPTQNYSTALQANDPLVGEFVPNRELCTQLVPPFPSSGTVVFSFFTATKTETISTLTTYTGSSLAAATPTICRMAVFSVDGSGNLTQVGVTPNDTTLFAAVNAAYPKALSASFTKTAGQRYATAVLIVTGVALPSFVGSYGSAITATSSTILLAAPTLAARVAGQSDMPSSVLVGSLVSYYARPVMLLS